MLQRQPIEERVGQEESVKLKGPARNLTFAEPVCQEHSFRAGGYKSSHEGSLVYLHVDKIDPTLEALSGAGGKTLMPRTSIGEHGFIAHFEDTEGNRVALHEYPAA